jgi:hypothetical protein
MRPDATDVAYISNDFHSPGESLFPIKANTLSNAMAMLNEAVSIRAKPNAAGMGTHQKLVVLIPLSPFFLNERRISNNIPIKIASIEAFSAPYERY